MAGVTRTTQRSLKLSALLIALFTVSTHRHAVPWREKPGLRLATTLPNRIIDSIMAQGNWNILFQEGPFAEFQRQIAVATHFSFRGQHTQADQYFQRADTALEIAYANLRGRFGWPRRADTLLAADLAWGENRDTFQDYLLCRLQLYIESGLKKHEAGELRFSAFDQAIADRQRQLGVPIRSKDADLDSFVRLLKESLEVRQLRAESAQRFALISDRQQVAGKSYWQRRAQLFLIFENIYHGNLSRAFHLTGHLQRRDSAQTDQLMLARVLLQVSDYAGARDTLIAAISDAENLTADSFADYVHYAELLQNLHMWLQDYSSSAAAATAAAAHLQKLVDDGLIAREDLVEVRTTIENQRLRAQKFVYLQTKRCPADGGAEPLAAEQDIEWQVREQLFRENCGSPVAKAWWRQLLASNATADEVRALAAHALGNEAVKVSERLAKQARPSPLTAYVTSRSRLVRALAKGAVPVALLADHLQALNALVADLTFLDWGILPKDDLIAAALLRLPQKAAYRDAVALFSGLHRHYALKLLRGKPLLYFAPQDAAAINMRFSALLPERRREEQLADPPAAAPGHDLVFAGDELQAEYRVATRSINRSIGENFTRPLLFGNFFRLRRLVGPVGASAAIAPLFYYCEQCSQHNKADRLIVPRKADNDSTVAVAELSDTFAATPAYRNFGECNTATPFRDTLLIDHAASDLLNLPCDVAAERLLLPAAPEVWQQAAAALAMGWRSDLFILVLPENLPVNIRTAFLYDLFQRTNRRQTKMATAFSEAVQRAEKSLAHSGVLQSVQLYGYSSR